MSPACDLERMIDEQILRIRPLSKAITAPVGVIADNLVALRMFPHVLRAVIAHRQHALLRYCAECRTPFRRVRRQIYCSEKCNRRVQDRRRGRGQLTASRVEHLWKTGT